ncbi:MAG: glutamate--tRNA ligase [Bacteroidota bacterium]
MEKEVRVRFAPSPTGALHIGGVRTALYNYLFARKNNGKMVLRIEDTDQTRFVKGAEEYIKNSLAWVGIETDENPDLGGPYGPYRQSERKDIYQQYAEKLLQDGNAYYAFDTPEELDAMRAKLKEAKVAAQTYNSITRNTMKNSLTLSEEEVNKRIESGEPYVIRLKVPKKEEVRLNDMVRGWVMVHSSAIDDKVIMKSDGMPTYHLANVVDDYLMKITHVIRGEEWLPSAPLHVLLYKFLGWENSMPQFGHLPLLLKPEGSGKLSKRDADKHGFPIFPMDWPDPESGDVSTGFEKAGYLPDAFINFLALLGWNPGSEQEIFSLEELAEAFSIERINKGGAKFDIEKAKWFNQQYIKQKSAEELSGFLKQYIANASVSASESQILKACELMKERITFPRELWTSGSFLFQRPETYDGKVMKKKWTGEAVAVLEDFASSLLSMEEFTAETIKNALNQAVEKNEIGLGRVMPAVRLAITGLGSGPDLMSTIEIIGKEEAIDRINIAIEKLEVKQS